MTKYLAHVALAANVLCTIGITYTTISDEWKRESIQGLPPSLQNLRASEGLWSRCTGNYQAMTCDGYAVPFFSLPPQLQGMRAMMCLATMLGVFSCVATIFGLPCIANIEERQKVMACRAAGLMALVAGALCLGAVSWYAAEVIYDFWSPLSANNSFKYEFGAAVYVGWIAAGLAIISGILLACCTCGNDDEGEEYRYAYKPPTNKPSGPSRNAEYV